MSPQQYVAHLRKLGLTTAAAAPVLGILRRQSFRYAAGDAPIPEPVAKLVLALVAAHDVCGFDWYSNDRDAVQAIDRLRVIIGQNVDGARSA
jgi:hypothetical protein